MALGPFGPVPESRLNSDLIPKSLEVSKFWVPTYTLKIFVWASFLMLNKFAKKIFQNSETSNDFGIRSEFSHQGQGDVGWMRQWGSHGSKAKANNLWSIKTVQNRVFRPKNISKLFILGDFSSGADRTDRQYHLKLFAPRA